MNTILFTNARDEDNIIEWINYHKLLGFSKIYIYDHMSINPIQNILDENKIDEIMIERIDTENIWKCGLMDKSFKYAKDNMYDWMLYLDADEYLILPNDKNLTKFLEKYTDYQQIGINWLMFGSNYHDKKPQGGLLENYTKCDNNFHTNIKAFVKPEYVMHVINPHCYRMKNSNLSIGINFEQLNIEKPWQFNLNISDNNFNCVDAYIAHYIFQSYETYLMRKKNRKRDDTGGDWHWNFNEITLHNQFNKIENLMPYNIKKFLFKSVNI